MPANASESESKSVPGNQYYNPVVSHPKPHRLGRRAEWAALSLLIVKGYRLLHRNWRGAGGELDLVMRRGDTTVFVEVKARSDVDFGGAAAHFDRQKQQMLIRVSAAYLGRYDLWHHPCRYDLVVVERTGGFIPWRIRHYRDVFQPNLGRQF
jgi:putative endonuclease